MSTDALLTDKSFSYLSRRTVSSLITKTRLYNFDPLKPHFYIVKLGFTGLYIIFLISAQNIDCEYSLEPPSRGGSNEYHNLCFVQKYEKYPSFLSENFQFLEMKFSVYLNRRFFVMFKSTPVLAWVSFEQMDPGVLWKMGTGFLWTNGPGFLWTDGPCFPLKKVDPGFLWTNGSWFQKLLKSD